MYMYREIKIYGVYAYLFFVVILCTPQGGIELNASVCVCG